MSLTLVTLMVFVGILLCMVAGVQVTTFLEKKRGDALRVFAEQYHFSYFRRDSGWPGLPSLAGLALFSQGRCGETLHVMTQRTQRYSVHIFDYNYKDDYGTKGSFWPQTVLLFEASSLALPSFTLVPKTFLYRIEKIFAPQKFDRTSSAIFSRHYVLRRVPRPDIRPLFNQRVRTFYNQHPGLITEVSANLLLVYRAGRQVPARKIAAFMEEGFTVFNLFTGSEALRTKSER